MKFRRVPPVYSPISARALWRGLRAALSRGEADRARAELDEWVRQTYGPTEWLWTDSGTGALMLALRIAKAAGRRRVALPAYGCYDLATACDGAGVEVALYDVDPATLGPDWASLEGVLAGGSDIVVVAYLYGIPVDLDRVGALASRYGAVFIEDAAQGVGGSWQGRPLGAHGDLAVLSFGRGKGLTAGGGGLLMARGEMVSPLVRRHDQLESKGRGLRPLLVALAQAILARPSLYWIPAMLPILQLGRTIYHPCVEPGAMSGSAFGILAETTAAVEEDAAVRRGNDAVFRETLPDHWRAGVVATDPRGARGSLRLAVRAPTAEEVQVIDQLRWLGIERSYPACLADLPGFGPRCLPGSGLCPGARLLASRLVTLPTHRWIEPRMMSEISIRIPVGGGLDRPPA